MRETFQYYLLIYVSCWDKLRVSKYLGTWTSTSFVWDIYRPDNIVFWCLYGQLYYRVSSSWDCVHTRPRIPARSLWYLVSCYLPLPYDHRPYTYSLSQSHRDSVSPPFQSHLGSSLSVSSPIVERSFYSPATLQVYQLTSSIQIRLLTQPYLGRYLLLQAAFF